MNQNTDTRLHVTRRTVLEAGTAAVTLSFIGHPQLALGAGLPDAETPPGPVTVGLQINGRPHTLTVIPARHCSMRCVSISRSPARRRDAIKGNAAPAR